MTDKKTPLIVQMVTMQKIDTWCKPYSALYGLSDTGEVYLFNFGDRVFAQSIDTHEEMIDHGTYRSPLERHETTHIGYKNRGWEKVENFVNAIPTGFELQK